MCSTTVLSIITDQIVHEARQQLGDKLDKVLLYGSYARGDFDDESDIDIMILADIPEEETWQTNMRLNKVASRLGLEHNIVISPYVTVCGTFYKWLDVLPFYQNVMREGVNLSA
jgi:predicted nucleotidyltransferase